MDATNSHLGELQNNLLLSYEAENPIVVHLYPQAVANPAGKYYVVISMNCCDLDNTCYVFILVAVVRSMFPGQSGFRIIPAPEHRVSQQPPLSIAPIIFTHLEGQQYRGFVPAAILVGGVSIFLYLFARVSI